MRAIDFIAELGGSSNPDAEDILESFIENHAPSGSGIDCGTKLIRAGFDGVVLGADYHHMNDAGYYDGWSEHEIKFAPDFALAYSVSISGRDRNGIKDYLADLYNGFMSSGVEEMTGKSFNFETLAFDLPPDPEPNPGYKMSVSSLLSQAACPASDPRSAKSREFIAKFLERHFDNENISARLDSGSRRALVFDVMLNHGNVESHHKATVRPALGLSNLAFSVKGPDVDNARARVADALGNFLRLDARELYPGQYFDFHNIEWRGLKVDEKPKRRAGARM